MTDFRRGADAGESPHDGPFDIRPMTEETVPAVADLGRRIFSRPWSEDGIRETWMSGQTVFLLAFGAEGPVGFLSMKYVLDEGSILQLGVLPGARRRGAASALLRTLLREARSLSLARVTLEVREGNEAAVSLYGSFHFVEVGKRKNFYSGPVEHALLMTAFLQEDFRGGKPAPHPPRKGRRTGTARRGKTEKTAAKERSA